jgi:hypothetical protein
MNRRSDNLNGTLALGELKLEFVRLRNKNFDFMKKLKKG